MNKISVSVLLKDFSIPVEPNSREADPKKIES